MKTRQIIWLLLLLSTTVRADNFISILSGDWDAIGNWQQNGAAATRVPQAGDDVVLMNFMQVNVNSAATNVTYGADWIGINVLAGATLTVSGTISVPGTLAGNGIFLTNATSSIIAGGAEHT